MEGTCECARSGVITVCSCDHHYHREEAGCDCSKVGARPPPTFPATGGYRSASYWTQPMCVNSDRLKTSIHFSNSGPSASSSGLDAPACRDMGPPSSWRHSSCFPSSSSATSCLFVKRLNRTYVEHRMRCLLTTVIAFCLGISVGALLPFFFPSTEPHLLPSLPHPSPRIEISLESLTSRPLFQHHPPKFVESISSTTNRALQIPAVVGNPGATPSSSYSPVSFVENSSVSLSTSGVVSGDRQNSVPVAEGIYWSDWVERLLPRGFTDENVARWRAVVGNSTVTTVEAGCGRMQNRLVTYDSGKKGCCRYRQNFDQIQGEIFSFYLSQLLGIRNLAPSTMDVINSKSVKWNGVTEELQGAQWVDDRPVVLTQFVNNLGQAFIPNLLRSSSRRVHPQDVPPLSEESAKDHQKLEELIELAQWSDLIVFDYLTANLDRMVNNLYNLQWNPTMMEAPAHNLAKDTSTGLLIFLDNESGLLHGYRLLDKYEHYHRLMLDSLCVFRKSTVEAIQKLHDYGSIQPLFKSMMLSQGSSKSHQLLPMIPEKSIKVLNQRIDTVHRQIQKCQSLYSSNTKTGNHLDS